MKRRSHTLRRILVTMGILLGSAAVMWWWILSSRKTIPKPPELANQPALPGLIDPRIVIHKADHRLFVHDGDKLVKTYRAAFGPGAGDKVREGDGCTPEGEFYVCLKNPRSRFTLSLGLSYPNIEDARRGLNGGLIDRRQHDAIVRAIRTRGKPPWKTPLGGEIMIHGCGSGSDWTAGCVALDDDDMTELYHALPVGTPVTIRP